jgi:cellulose synthase/poly-beta-1,6-N-acetylglucosamine synthase-like glycosyltransferase
MGEGKYATRDSLRAAGVEPSADLLAHACEGLHRAFPSRSAKHVVTLGQGAMLALLFSLTAAAIRAAPWMAWHVAHAAAYALCCMAIFWRLFAAASLERPRITSLYSPAPGQSWPIYTILCPLYREANVVFDLVAALERIDYPKHALDIKLLVEADDLDTLAAALAAAREPHIEVVFIPASKPRTKPKALNVGLGLTRGDYVVVYDAEDRPHPAQLRAALTAFEEHGDSLACVQAPLVIDNAKASWIARQFAAEYAIQFGGILPLLSRLGLPLPLGGSSNHFRTDVLHKVGAWDPYNVTEDADLGYRLAREGFAARMIAPPTFEEAPTTFSAWLGQRTRWIKGHLQTYLILAREPFSTSRQLGFGGVFALHMTLGAGIAGSFLHGPLTLLLLAAAITPFDLLAGPDLILVMFSYCVAAFAALTATAISGELGHLRAALTMPLYWPLSSIAALRAVFALIFRPHYWSKTAHGMSQRASHMRRNDLSETA